MCQVYKTVPGKVILVRIIRTDVKYGLHSTSYFVMYCSAVSKFGTDYVVFVWMYIGIPKVSWAYARKGTAGYASVCFPDFCHPHRYNLPLENIGIINHELPIYIRYLRTALNECSMLLALLAIWTNANYSWAKTLVLCRRQEIVLCRQPIGAHGAFVCVVCGWHWRSCASGER